MVQIGPKMPWGTWFKIHSKAICQALPIAFLITVESRDMYYRATWQVVSLPGSEFATGDIVAICNRWYTLPTWGHVLYSLLSKVLLKSTWDDVGVIVVADDGMPHLIYCDFTGAHEEPLGVFLQTRLPRGAALRKLHLDEGMCVPSTHTVKLFMEEAMKLKAQPWYLFSASMRHNHEHKYYNFCVKMNAQRRKIRDMMQHRHSHQAIRAQQDVLREMEVMRQHLATLVKEDKGFHLFNGSLVASLLATLGLLERERPSPAYYVPQDFAHDPPFAGAAFLNEPVVFFRN